MSWDKTKPGNVKMRVGRQQILDNNAALETALQRDHNFPGTAGVDDGEHAKVTLHAPLAVDPTNEADKGFLYLKDVSGKAELFFEDEDGHVIQLTTGGALNPTGVVLLAGAQTITGAKTFQADITLDGGNVVMSGSETVDGVDVSAHKAGTAKSQHTAGVGDHTHQSAGAEGGVLSSASILSYDSGWFGVTKDQSYTKTHNLGVLPKFASIWFSANADGSNARLIEGCIGRNESGQWHGISLKSVGTTSCEVITGENYIFFWRGGSDTNANATYGYCRVVLMG